MDEYKFDMNIRESDDNSSGIGISCRFKNYLAACVTEQLPQYKDIFPFLKGISSKTLFAEKLMIFTVSYQVHMSVVSFGTLKDDKLISKVNEKINDSEIFSYEQIKNILGSDYMNSNTFTYFSNVSEDKISSKHFFDCITEWLNKEVLPVIFENNRKRVLDAIPEPPNFNMALIENKIFVIDDCSNNIEDLGKQGTSFYIKDIGFVTCNHVLTDGMQLFQSNHLTMRYDISIRKRNKDIDIAIFDANGIVPEGFEIGDSDELSIMDHIAVVGFPKYKPGDKGFLSPGLITGFRPVSGIQRIVVNSPIIAGNSGGPVINSNNKVIGIAVKGFSGGDIEPINEVIPVNAIKYLL